MSALMLGEVRLRFESESDSEVERGYRAGPARISSNQPIEESEPFSISEAGTQEGAPSLDWATKVPTSLVYEGPGWVGGREETVRCAAGSGFYRLQVGRDLEMVLGFEAGHCLLRINAPASDQRARHAVLGPGLALALAERGTFSWHSSAALLGSRLLLFMGPSGAGKSTLARRAALTGGVARVADDIVPVTMTSHGLEACPSFPQLKLSGQKQWGGSPSLSVAEVLLMVRQPTGDAPVRSCLSAREAALRLVDNTVASRLFAPALRKRHLDFCICAVAAMRVLELRIPDDLNRLDEVVELLAVGPS